MIDLSAGATRADIAALYIYTVTDKEKEILGAVIDESSYGRAAESLNTPRSTVCMTMKRIKDRAKTANPQKVKKLNLRVDDPVNRSVVVYFTDAHNQPGMDMDRFEWLAGFINDVNPDAVIDGGDFDDIESLCAHVKDDTIKGRFKPLIKDDMEQAIAARQLLHERIKIKCRKFVTLGNHEQRLFDYEDQHPATYNTIANPYLDILERFGWEVTQYRDWLDYKGVDFTHVPMNGMNKPVGGKRPHVTNSNNLIRDLCFGHTHSYGMHIEHKMGPYPGRSIKILNGGCFMPEGYVGDYAKGSHKQNWYGVHKIVIEDGRMADVQSISMRELSLNYRSQI